jgi:hypothetical protein
MSSAKDNMWRSVRHEDFPDGVVNDGKAALGVLYPDFEPKLITGGRRKGQYRDPDVVVKDGCVSTGGGTSLFNKKGVFPPKYWEEFHIPISTVIPDSLVLTGPKYNKVFDADHYQIEVRCGKMTIEAFKGALDNLARNAIVQQCADK